MSEFSSNVLVTERRRSTNRRSKPEQKSDRKPLTPAREANVESKVEATSAEINMSARREIIDRRRQDRRRQIDPTTCERDYSDGEIEFMRAMDDYKRKSGRPFPTWSEVLEVVMSLGYRKVADPSTLEWRTFGENMGSL